MITENGLINGERFFNGSSNKRSVSPDFAHNEHNKDFEVKHQKKKKKKTQSNSLCLDSLLMDSQGSRQAEAELCSRVGGKILKF